MKILIVCSSNVCRSPYAEFVMRKMVEDSQILKNAGIEISSSAVFNHSAKLHSKAHACLVAEGFEEDYVSSHKPSFKWSDAKRFENADVIIGMSNVHKMLTPKKYRSKFFTLSEIAIGEYHKIPDPFTAKSQEKYDEVMLIIKEYVDLYVNKLETEFVK